jgi:steroid 5-alpha reductase family enzyme
VTAVLASLAAVAVIAVVVMTVTALVARRQGRVVVVDVAWGVALTLAAVAAAAVGTALGEGTPWRAWVLAAAVGVWGLRLSWHIHQRSGNGEDPRYELMLGGPLHEVGMGVAVRKVFAIQGAAVCLVALPVTLGAVIDVEWTPLVVVGLVGWWGIWLAGALASGLVMGAVTVVAPLVMTYFLVWATGAKLLEKNMMQRPAYREYARRTSMFVPLPPKRSPRPPTLSP